MLSPDVNPRIMPETRPALLIDFIGVTDLDLRQSLSRFADRIKDLDFDYLTNPEMAQLPFGDEEMRILPQRYRILDLGERLRTLNIIPHHKAMRGKKNIVLWDLEEILLIDAFLWLTKDREYKLTSPHEIDDLKRHLGTNPLAEIILPPNRRAARVQIVEFEFHNIDAEKEESSLELAGEGISGDEDEKKNTPMTRMDFPPYEYLLSLQDERIADLESWTPNENLKAMDKIERREKYADVSSQDMPPDIQCILAAIYGLNERKRKPVQDLLDELTNDDIIRAGQLINILFGKPAAPTNLAEIVKIIRRNPQKT